MRGGAPLGAEAAGARGLVLAESRATAVPALGRLEVLYLGDDRLTALPGGRAGAAAVAQLERRGCFVLW